MTRNKFVSQMQSWIGRKEADGSHKAIIDIYNSHKPLARGYKVKYTDSWCATTVSACAIATGMTDIVPLECSCEEMIKLAKAMGIWEENDAYIPKPADIILYDWQDSGKGDNVGWADHIGVVEKCDGKTITVIEGNINDSVGRRTIGVNAKYIRGFICPKFKEESNSAPASEEDRNMRFKLLEEMNMRSAPNGTLIQAVPEGTVISGTKLVTSGSVQWLYTAYNSKAGYVAVLPESKKYAVELKEPNFTFTLDSANANGISGWLYDGTDKAYELHCYINDHGFNSIYANIFRQDLKDAGIGNGKHGFNWDKDLYEIFGNGTFKMSIFAITESGSNPCVYDGEITIYREPKKEEPPKEEVPKPIEEPTPIVVPIEEPVKTDIEETQKLIDKSLELIQADVNELKTKISECIEALSINRDNTNTIVIKVEEISKIISENGTAIESLESQIKDNAIADKLIAEKVDNVEKSTSKISDIFKAITEIIFKVFNFSKE